MKLFQLSPSKEKLRNLTALIWKRSGDPTHPDNIGDPDWQAGYLYGSFTTNKNDDMDDIFSEWQRRGSPKSITPEFKSWKAGYWAGRYTQL